MRTFQDSSKKGAWPISLPIGTVLRIRDESGGRFNLFDPSSLVDGVPLATAIQFDVPLFWELLWFVVAAEAKKFRISAERFGELMTAECCRSAREAFQAEWLDFFRELSRPDQMQTVGRAIAMRESLQKTIEKQIPIQRELDQPILDGLNQRLTNLFGDWAASWDLIPDGTPGDN
jgi:hypothetical protein